MNPELPKSIRGALAQQKLLTTHPSADMLTAFAERALTAGENERVADHLAGCLECREVLFLATNAEEQGAVETTQAAKVDLRPRSTWMPRLAWAASGIAVVAIVAGVWLQQHLAHDRSNQKSVQVAQVSTPATQPPPITPNPETAYIRGAADLDKAPQPPKAKPSQAGKMAHQYSDIAATKPPPPTAHEASVTAGAPLAKPANQPPGAVAGEQTSDLRLAAPTTSNSFVEAPEGTMAKGFAAGKMSGLFQVPARPGGTKTWRITPAGHLEHLSPTGWMGTLTDQPVTFRVVAESPNGVWAGANHGELFHSADAGEHWNQVALPFTANGTNDAIVAIQFTDLQHGVVLSESGARYVTSDGGKTWQSE